MKYLIDLETQLQMFDIIYQKYRPLDMSGFRFLPTLRFPINGVDGSEIEKSEIEHYSLKGKLNDSVSETPYLSFMSCNMVREALLNIIYMDTTIQTANALIRNNIIEASECFYNPKETPYEIIVSYLGQISEVDFKRIEDLLISIYKNTLEPIIGIGTKNIWDINFETNQVWLVNMGNVFEYRYKEAEDYILRIKGRA